jgi:hypothetical protein
MVANITAKGCVSATRIARLADALELLSRRIKSESVGDTGNLHARFGGSLAEVLSLRAALAAKPAATDEMRRLNAVLAELETVIACLPRKTVALVSRAATRRKNRDALRLSASMRKLLRRAALATGLTAAGGLVVAGSLALASPDSCDFIGTMATCSGNQSDGISFIDIPNIAPISGVFPYTLKVSDLDRNIAPAIDVQGINLDQELNFVSAAAGVVGASSSPFVITTDGSAAITANGTAAIGIRAYNIAGNGGDNASGDGGAGGAGASITVDNKDAITTISSRTLESRAVEFGEQGLIGDSNNAIAQANSAIANLQGTDNSLSAILMENYFQNFYGVDTSTPAGKLALIGKINTAIGNIQDYIAYLNATPYPEETSQLIAGAISVTSIGGNGGFGGLISFGQNANGGDGGTGGAIAITNNATIKATGGLVAGIAAESIGGNGGGSLGDFGTNFINNPIYGYGGHGGTGGAITINNSGSITTVGDSAPGIFALSRGGLAGDANNNPNFTPAGGTGGLVTVNESGIIATSGLGSYGILAESEGSIGLSGGDAKIGGAGGNVVVDVTGKITTTGEAGYGVFGRSVGGTGGNGSSGDSGGDGGPSGLATITVEKSGTIATTGDNAIALYGQSKGGIGGSGGDEDGFWASAGGGGNGGVGGDVHISNAGTLTTKGDYAYGLFAQALGGAGGLGGDAAGLIAISGSGGGGSPAGNVTASNSGTIVTLGTGANAFYTQSVGGLGGDAGSAGGLAALGSNGGSEAADRCINFGLCLNGGNITAVNSGTLSASGASASGMFVESIGGGGGNGGGSSGLFSWGGSGGAGGNGGTLNVTNTKDGSIQIGGDNAEAIFAQSVGGGGGNGGDATSVGATFSVAIGGSGGSGGKGGTVSVINNGGLDLNGYNDTAIFAQSVGGGGGNGGDATSIAASAAISVSVAIGGSGGGGGNGSAVSVNNGGTIHTQGDFSDAVFAQSVGGGGGNGGAAYATSFAAGGGDIPAIAVSLALGGKGGNGGNGSNVTVTNTGTIETDDWNARGIFAQSVGGGGGDGGSSEAKSIAAAPDGFTAEASFAIGGSGGGGGTGGNVLVTNDGSVLTFGSGSHAIFAQSVGGGGGTGGDASTTTASLSSDKDAEISLSIGGKGGSGGNGGAAKVVNNGSVTTVGDLARGITAQSIGGGGGDGGAGVQGQLINGVTLPTIPNLGDDLNGALKNAAFGDFDALKKEYGALKESPKAYGKKFLRQQLESQFGEPSSFGVSIGVGGAGGIAGNGGLADVQNAGDVMTTGFMSYGIFSQSVGGGGGSGGGGNGSGSGDLNVGGGFGGTGGSAGDGGKANVTNTGSITTFGDLADGIFAQSIGGGGGDAGTGNGQGSGLRSLSVSIGGQAGSAGDGEAVTVAQNGDVVTFGTSAMGVFAQSVGGGGGVGGAAQGQNYLTVAVGGAGGAGGDGGNVNVSVKGSIATSGNYAHGVFAQSVGGGGGLAGSVEAATLVLSDPFGLTQFDTGVPFTVGTLSFTSIGTGVCDTTQPGSIFLPPVAGPSSCGNGGNITVNITGDISTTGKAAYGIFAQSIGGGGGFGDQQTGGDKTSTPGLALIGSTGGAGTAGTITINHKGNIQVFGEDSIGILAQSLSGANATTHVESGGRGSNIAITVSGIVQGGTGGGAGVFISGGDKNTLTNKGGDIFALSGLAVIGSDGDDTIDNAGTITGSVGLGAGANAFVNEKAGVFETGKAVYLGSGNALTSGGTISVGGAHAIAATLLTGNLTQTSTGTLLSDVNYSNGASDLITVDGNVSLAGKAAIVTQDITGVKPNSYFTVLTTAGSLTDKGISIDDTLVVDYGLKFVGKDLQVGVNTVQFNTGAALTPQQTIIANYIQTLWQQGAGTALTPLLDYLAGLTDSKTYASLLSHLDPSTGLNQWTSGLLAGSSSVNNLMSCPGTTDADSALREHECFWARTSGTAATRNTTASQPGFNSSGYQYAMGGQVMLSPGWFAGGSASLAENFTDVQNLAHEKSDNLSAGLVVKHEDGDWLFAGAVNVQYGWNDLTRSVAFPLPSTNATSSPNQFFLDGRVRTAYLGSSGDFYFKPWVAADIYYSDVSGIHEKGAGALGLIVNSANKTFGSGTVGAEMGLLETSSDGTSFRPYVSADATAFTDNSWDASARFEGAPAGTPNFKVTTKFPGVLGRLAGGIEINLPTGSLRLEYERRFGDHYTDQTGSLKIRFPM